jgi:hypothetical protein
MSTGVGSFPGYSQSHRPTNLLKMVVNLKLMLFHGDGEAAIDGS